MADEPIIPDDWTPTERWVWHEIAAGRIADLNARDRAGNAEFKDLDPTKPDGWGDRRHLRASFLQTILTRKHFVEAIPFAGVRIRGALIDDADLDLDHARLASAFWLERSRMLRGVYGFALRVDGSFSLERSFVSDGVTLQSAQIHEGLYMSGSTLDGRVTLNGAKVAGSAFLRDDATFKGEVNLGGARIGSNLEMTGSICEGPVILNRATVDGSAFLGGGATFKGALNLISAHIGSNLDAWGSAFDQALNLDGVKVEGAVLFRDHATFKSELDLTGARIGSNLEMTGSTFEGPVTLSRATVDGAALLRGRATFKGELDLSGAHIGSDLEMTDSTFEGRITLTAAIVEGSALLRGGATFKDELGLVGARIGSNLEMAGSTFEARISAERIAIGGSAFLCRNATFKRAILFPAASIGSDLDLTDAQFDYLVDLSGAKAGGELRLGSLVRRPARWGENATLILRNFHVGALQDWWRSDDENSWPRKSKIDLEGFAYDRLGGFRGEGDEADMAARPTAAYVQWLARDWTFSPQPYEQLALVFRQAGEPAKANAILYAGRERRRRGYWARTDERGRSKRREWARAAGLWLLRATIGYGLGTRYFRALGWVALFTVVGCLVLHFWGVHATHRWLEQAFASFDELVPIITLNKAHDALVFGGASLHPPYGVAVYFYVHRIVGWLLGSFVVAGLAGLTQRN